MVAQLNRPEEKIDLGVDGIQISRYEPFEGSNLQKMPELLRRGRTPMPAFMLMERRPEASADLPDWKNSWFDTADLIAYDSSKRSDKVKFILTVDNQGNVTEVGRRALDLINPNAPLVDYAVDLSGGDLYDSLQGEGVIEVSRGDLGAVEKRLTGEEIDSSKPWRIWARHPDEVPAEFSRDKSMLQDYRAWVASETGQSENMGVYLDSNGEKAKLRALCVYGRWGRSLADGRNNLDHDNGRLVE